MICGHTLHAAPHKQRWLGFGPNKPHLLLLLGSCNHLPPRLGALEATPFVRLQGSWKRFSGRQLIMLGKADKQQYLQ